MELQYSGKRKCWGCYSPTGCLSDKYVMRTLFCSVLSLWLICGAAAVRGQNAPTSAPATSAAPVASSPLPGSRVVKTFDFEETRLGNFESIPMFWSKVVGRGYPAYSSGGFDRTVYRSANSSFKLETNGGSVAYRFTPPPEQAITVRPESDYYILAFVRTSELKHARADLAAWFADDQGNLIPSTEVHSLPYNLVAPGAGGGRGI